MRRMNLPDDCDRYSYYVMRCEPPQLRYRCALVGVDEDNLQRDCPDSFYKNSQRLLTLTPKSNFTLCMHTIHNYWILLSASFYLNSGMASNVA